MGLGLLAFASVTWSRADEFAEKGRAIYQSKQHVVVTVQVSIKSKLSMPGVPAQSSETHRDLTGTVIDPSGLVVLSLSATDPAELLQSRGGAEDPRFKVETELSGIRILLQDGTEVPAEMALREKNLDLAFIRPKDKLAQPLQALDLSQSGVVDVLDQVIALNRLGSAVDRAYSASVERIAAIVREPHLYYVPDANLTSTTLGAPAFALDGKPIGIFVMKAVKSKSGGAMSVSGAQNENLAGIIVPAADIFNVSRQALERREGTEAK